MTVVVVGTPLLWLLLAYAGLLRLWPHHDRREIDDRRAIPFYTAQDIPVDPFNLHIYASKAAIITAYRSAGCSKTSLR